MSKELANSVNSSEEYADECLKDMTPEERRSYHMDDGELRRMLMGDYYNELDADYMELENAEIELRTKMNAGEQLH